MLTSVGAFVLIADLQDDRFQAEYIQQCAALTAALKRAAETGTAQVDSLADLYLSSTRVEPHEFEDFVRGILARHASIKALSWAPRVTETQRVVFETTNWDDVSEPLQITERVIDGGLGPAASRSEYFPVYYVEPRIPNAAALGFDLASENSRSNALRRAAGTGLQTSTSPIVLVQSASEGMGFVVANPVYSRTGGLTTPADRLAGLEGFVTGVFLVSELVDYAFLEHLPDWMGITLHDKTEPSHPVILFSHGAESPTMSSLSYTSEFQIAGRTWGLRFVPSRSRVIEMRTPSPWYILAAGLLMTALLCVSLTNSARHTLSVEQAEEQTRRALRAREAALAETHLLEGISRKINGGHGISEILDFVYTSFSEIIPFDRIGLALLEDDGQRVRSRWARSRQGEMHLRNGYAADLRGSSLLEVFESGVPRIIDDLPAYLAAHPNSRSTRLIVQEGMQSSLTCPLTVKGKSVGFLFFSSVKPLSYAPSHTETFMRLAQQLSVSVEKGRLYDALAQEKQRSEQILNSLLPAEILLRVKNGEQLIADECPEASVVFADLVGFSNWSGQCTPLELVTLLNALFRRFDLLAQKFGLLKIGTQGDCHLAVAGIPTHRPDHVELAAEYALALQEAVVEFCGPDQRPLSLRIGIHTGPVVAGVLGRRAFRYDVWGRTVNLASRMESLGESGRIQISEETAVQLQNYQIMKRGSIHAKGFGQVETYWLEGRAPSDPGQSGRRARVGGKAEKGNTLARAHDSTCP